MNDDCTSHCTSQMFHKAVFFPLETVWALFCYLQPKKPWPMQSHFCSSFCFLFYLCARWCYDNWTESGDYVSQYPLPCLVLVRESWLKRNVYHIWNERRRAIPSHEVAAVSHVDGQIGCVWWTPNSLFCTLCPPQLFYYWCWRPTGVKVDL